MLPNKDEYEVCQRRFPNRVIAIRDLCRRNLDLGKPGEREGKDGLDFRPDFVQEPDGRG